MTAKYNSLKLRYVYIDHVRVLAIFFVIFHHLNFHFIDSGLFTLKDIWSNYLFNISYGDLGVSLFLIISGFGLTLSQKGKVLNTYHFYKKRIQKIYPLFWITYFFFYIWYSLKHILPATYEKQFLLFSLTGLDTYFLSFFKFISYTYFDWFIGFIILIYLIYPLLYKIYLKNQYLLVLLASISIIASISYFSSSLNYRFLPLRLFEICLGMIYINIATSSDIIKHVKIFVLMIIILFLSLKIAPSSNFSIYHFFVKLISLDFIIIELSFFLYKILNLKWLNQLIIYLASISYSMFLIQHQIIIRFIDDLALLNKPFLFIKTYNSLSFEILIIITLIIILSMFLTAIEKLIMNNFNLTNLKHKRFLESISGHPKSISKIAFSKHGKTYTKNN